MSRKHSQPSLQQSGLTVLLALGLAHCLNDVLQAVVSASYPVIKDSLGLTFSQIGITGFVYQLCASIFQPFFGTLFDKYPRTWYLTLGTLSTMVGLAILAFSTHIWMVIVSVAFIGLGSSIIHPEASRLTHYASNGKHGLAQSIFQVGGNFGSALGPLFAAYLIAPYGQRYILLCLIVGVIALLCRRPITQWYKEQLPFMGKHAVKKMVVHRVRLSKNMVYLSLALLLILIFSKYVYTASLVNYYTFYLIEKFDVTTQQSQIYLFGYLFASAAGTLIGGPLGDHFGRKYIIWVSILGAAPFALLLPHVNLFWTCVLSIVIGFVISSAFSAILVYAQELLPTKVGLISGLFFGIAFGIAGVAAAVLGKIADTHSVQYVFDLCAYMPLLGIVAMFLPNVKPHSVRK